MVSSQEFSYSPLPSGHIRLLVLYPAFGFEDPVCVSIEHHDFVRSNQIFDHDTSYWSLKTDLELARGDLKEQNASDTAKGASEDEIPAGPFWDTQVRFEEGSMQLERLSEDRRIFPAQNKLSPGTDTNTSPVLYEAVSYAWGEENEKECITEISSNLIRSLGVRCNVVEMLRYLRRRSGPRRLWIDALCINQVDNDERGVQVQIMGEIYSYASRVLVWIGPPDPTYSILDIPGKIVDTTAILTLRRVLHRKWFKRRWVIQEVIHAREALFLCGHRSREFCDFAREISFHVHFWDEPLENQMDIEDTEEEVLINLGHLAELHKKKSKRTLQNQNMLQLLIKFRAADCSDKRDIFYAMNSLCNVPVPVDYDKSFDKLCFEFTSSELKQYPFRLLSYAAANPSDSIFSPSWVPDYMQQIPRHRCLKTCFEPLSPAINFSEFVIVEESQIVIKAVHLSTVRVVNTYLPLEVPDFSSTMANLSYLKRHERFFKTHRTMTKRRPVHQNNLLYGCDPLLVNALTNNTWEPNSEFDKENFSMTVIHHMDNRTSFFTEAGHFGTAPWRIWPGDILVSMPGSQILLALHPVCGDIQKSGEWVGLAGLVTVIGDCYVPELLVDKVLPTNGDLVTYKII